jgi:hypothetical protein
MEFFYEEPRGENDARATDYCNPGEWTATKPKAVWNVTGRINREIAHASPERVNLTEETRSWNTGEMRNALELTFKDFVKLAYPHLIPDRTREVLLDDGYRTDDQRVHVAGVSATNATVSESFADLSRGFFIPPGRVWIDPDSTLTSTSGLAPDDIARIHFAPPETQSS